MNLKQIMLALIGISLFTPLKASNAEGVFIILSGGPGLYNPEDKYHDVVWDNYIRPLLIQNKTDQLTIERDEKVHWLVYAPAYEKRWNNDKSRQLATGINNAYSETLRKTDCLCGNRQCPCADYMHIIVSRAMHNNWDLVKIRDAGGLWSHIKGLQPNQKVTRLWYVGHARHDGLMLSNPVNLTTEFISIDTIDPKLSSKFLSLQVRRHIIEKQYKQWSIGANISQRSNYIHNFYGCNTEAFALKWAQAYHVVAAGAKDRIRFNDIMANRGCAGLTEQAQWTVHSPEISPGFEHRTQGPGPIP